MARKENVWKLVSDYPIACYQCGAQAGERVRLRRDLIIYDHKGMPTADVHRAGEIWTILSGSKEPPVVIWLRRPDGDRHTWDDNAEFWDWFERFDEPQSHS